MPEISIEAARLAMIQKRFGGNVKGARTDDGVLRKKKSVHKSAGGIICLRYIHLILIFYYY